MKAKTSLVTAVLVASAMLGASAPVLADDARPTYDRKIEDAVATILKGKLGAMRGSLDLDTASHVVRPTEAGGNALVPDPAVDDLATGSVSGSVTVHPPRRYSGRIVWG